MLLLALDTTTRGGSCALTRNGAIVREHAGDGSMPQGSRVPGAMATLLADAGVTLDEVDAFAVAVGPGSFTGLRVGISAMQGLAFALGKALVGVSTLDALAHIARRSYPHLPAATWIDAWRGEVYSAVYEAGVATDGPILTAPDSFLRRFGRKPSVFIGDGASTHAAFIRELCGPDAVLHAPALPPLAGVIAQMATARWQAGERPGPEAVRPVYLRRPDAELVRDARD